MQEVEEAAKNDVKLSNKEGSLSQIYEVGYLLVPSITEEEIPAMYGNMKEIVSSFKGELISDEMPKMINLAYPMAKVVSNVRSIYNTAYFGWVKFSMDRKGVLELKAKLDLDPKVIRFLLIKTIRENTIASRRFGRGDMHSRKVRNESEETGVPIDKEEIDKEIDAMISA